MWTMGSWVSGYGSPNRISQTLNSFFGGLLRMEPGDLVGEDEYILHTPECAEIAFSRFQKGAGVVKAAHKALSPPEAPAPERG